LRVRSFQPLFQRSSTTPRSCRPFGVETSPVAIASSQWTSCQTLSLRSTSLRRSTTKVRSLFPHWDCPPSPRSPSSKISGGCCTASFADPALYPHLSPDTSPFMFRAPFAGLLMQVTQCLAQPRTTAAWDSSARANPTRGRQNSFAFLFHVGQLFEIFSDWATLVNPKAHCFVAALESHRACANLVVLGAATYDGANLHTKLEQWLTQFRAWFSPTALTSTAAPTAAAFLATTPVSCASLPRQQRQQCPPRTGSVRPPTAPTIQQQSQPKQRQRR